MDKTERALARAERARLQAEEDARAMAHAKAHPLDPEERARLLKLMLG